MTGTIPPPDAPGLLRQNAKLQKLIEVARALGAEKNIDKLLPTILKAATEVIDADRCSLFIVDNERGELFSKIAQGSSKEIRFKIGEGIAGQCAEIKKVINIDDPYADARFNPKFDKDTGYHTKSILTVPMLDIDGHCTGVLQALNKKGALAFTAEDEDLLMALGGSAAVAVENAFLHTQIEKQFESFITASVFAIEKRDPTTSGHSERVAMLSVHTAHAVTKAPPPEHRGLSFSEREIRELRFAATLHDFGKVGVREHVLVKANKLYPHELDTMKERFDHARARTELMLLERKVSVLEAKGLHGDACDVCKQLDDERARVIKELDDIWAFVQQCNRPTVLEQGGFERLQEIRKRTFVTAEGNVRDLLSEGERVNLSIPRGSLNQQERVEIESHVTHTFDFLRRIEWTSDLKRVPDIAGKHHEKLNGGGYPSGKITALEISPQTRIMTIADIYDALTASDRPYKKAMPHEKALDILNADAKKGVLDTSLLTVFIESGAHKLVHATTLEGQACEVP